MTAAILIGLIAGGTVGLSAAPLWMMLQLPMRVVDVSDAGSMRMSALALTLGTTLAALSPVIGLPGFMALLCFLISGIFVGMLASALVEAVEVVPVLFNRLKITSDMRWAALGLMLGKMAGIILAGILEV